MKWPTICDKTGKSFDHDPAGTLHNLMKSANQLHNNATKENLYKAIKMYEEACKGWQKQNDLLGAAKCLLNIANFKRRRSEPVKNTTYTI